MEDIQVAANMRARLVEQIGQPRFELWFGQHTKFRFDERTLTVVAPSTFARDWLRRNFAEDVKACCRAAVGRELHVEFEDAAAEGAEAQVVAAKPADCVANFSPNGETTPATITKQQTLLPDMARPDEKVRANPAVNGALRKPRKAAGQGEMVTPAERRASRAEPTFETLVVGKGNECAFGAAQLTGRGSQQASPLLLWGRTGVGKTHLLRAIRADFRQRHPRSRVVYLTAEQFIAGYVEAVRGSGLPSFRQKCRGADLLLLDDLQFVAGKQGSVAELLRMLDAMIAEGRQLVLASDRGLAELRPLGREIVSRLAGGLACEIGPADYGMRVGIVRRLCMELEFELDDEIASLVASQITAGAHELRGAIHRLQLTCVASNCRMTRQLAAETLAELAQQCVRTVRLADVEHAVCDVFGVDAAELRSERKSRSIQEPRMLAMWLARKFTRAPWSEIGEFFGRRSHSTVISAHRRVEELMRMQAQIGVGDVTCGVEEAIRRVEEALRIA